MQGKWAREHKITLIFRDQKLSLILIFWRNALKWLTDFGWEEIIVAPYRVIACPSFEAKSGSQSIPLWFRWVHFWSSLKRLGLLLIGSCNLKYANLLIRVSLIYRICILFCYVFGIYSLKLYLNQAYNRLKIDPIRYQRCWGIWFYDTPYLMTKIIRITSFY